MIVIAHHYIPQKIKSHFLFAVLDTLQQVRLVLVILKDVFPVIPPLDDVINRSFILHPWFPAHKQNLLPPF
ncbi:hypothetical protein [Desulforudis sp. 1031]|uniref:hypothetical protein n=1 Tax=Desulforudis sp. 1031 TaxID=3416138 RepID=UPI003CF686D1